MLALMVETQPLIDGTAVGIIVIGVPDGKALGMKVGADVRNATHKNNFGVQDFLSNKYT